MFTSMGDHCANCYCDPEKTYCGVRRRIFLKVILAFGTFSFIGVGILMVRHLVQNGISDFNTIETGLFTCLLLVFSVCYIIVIYMEASMYLELLWSIICGLYNYMWDGLYYIRDHVRLPSWQDTCVLFSARGAMTRTHPQQDISNSESESDEERPPLPPKTRKRTESAGMMPFQKLTSNISQGTSSSTARTDESEGSCSSILHRPQSSTQSLESSGRRGKKLSKRELFRNLMAEVSNLNPINEEDLDQQETSEVKVPLSLLTQSSDLGDETAQETSFTTQLKQIGAAEGRTSKIGESHEHVPSKGFSGRHAQARIPGTREKHKSHGQASASIVESSGKEQWSGTKDFKRQRSPEQPSTSSYVPFSELQVQSQASEKEEVQRMKSSEIRFSGSRGAIRASDSGSSQGQTSVTYVGLPELENQSREFGIRLEKQSSPEQQTLSYVPLSSLENKAQDQTSMSGLFGSQEQAQTCNIMSQKRQSQASASYVGLPELERQSREFGTTSREMNSPEIAPRYVPLSTLENKAQEQISPRGSPQGQVCMQHQSSSCIELPILERQSRKCEGRERIQSPEQQQMSNVQFSSSESQSEKQTSTARFLSIRSETQASDSQNIRGGQDQALASYVELPEFQKQSREFGIRAMKEPNSPEHQLASRYVPISPGDQLSGIQSIQRMQTNKGRTSTVDASDLQREARTPDIQRRRSGRKQTPPYYVRLSESERQSREKRSPQNPCTSTYVEFSMPKNKFKASDTDEAQVFSQEKAFQMRGQAEIRVKHEESGASEVVAKLRNLEQASVAGFPRATSQTGHFREDQKITSLETNAERMLAEKSGESLNQKRRGTLSIGPERLVRGSGSRTKCTEGSAERISGYTPYPILSRSVRTPYHDPVVIDSLSGTEKIENRIRKRSLTDRPCLKETGKYEAEKKETILSLNLATGGLVLSKEREEDKNEADSDEISFMYDQPIDVLDLSHIEVPLPPSKDEEATKEHRKD